jgi:hypothetical protein
MGEEDNFPLESFVGTVPVRATCSLPSRPLRRPLKWESGVIMSERRNLRTQSGSHGRPWTHLFHFHLPWNLCALAPVSGRGGGVAATQLKFAVGEGQPTST